MFKRLRRKFAELMYTVVNNRPMIRPYGRHENSEINFFPGHARASVSPISADCTSFKYSIVLMV